MATLHGILAELGLAPPPMMRPDTRVDTEWTTHPRFDPEEGTCYELAFVRIPPRMNEAPVIRRIRAEGPSAEDWIDLDTQRPLERELYGYAVKAYRRLDGETRLH